jgi:hypothetical protein
MNTIDEITARVNDAAAALTNIRWEPFRREALLVFSGDSSGKEEISLKLTGVHFFATRQSLFGGATMNHPRERNVRYFEISQSSPFLRQFINGEIRQTGEIFLYDTHNRPAEDPCFKRPFHVNVVCSDGILDVICEDVRTQ